MRRRAAAAVGLALAVIAGAAHAQPPPGATPPAAPPPAKTIPASRAFLIADVEVVVLIAAIVTGLALTERRKRPSQPPADEPEGQPEAPPDDDQKRPAR